jgi:hypothetical protein
MRTRGVILSLFFRWSRLRFAHALFVGFIVMNSSTTIHSKILEKPVNLNFSSYREAITYLGSVSRKVPAVASSSKIFVGRFNENINKIYCEPLASNFRNDMIASLKLKRTFLEEAAENMPMIKGEFKRQFSSRDFIKIRIKVGTFIKKNQQSLTFYISPWVTFPTKGLSSNEKTCLLKKVIGTASSVRLPRDTILRESPNVNGRIVSRTADQPVELLGFINEIDHRWWIFSVHDGISRSDQYLYAQNSAQFVVDDHFDRKSRECQTLSKDQKNQNIFKKGRKLFKQNLKDKISKKGFYRSQKPNLFGIRLLKMCQEIDSNNINYKIHYNFFDREPRELSHDIEFRQSYAGKTKYYDITGEIDSFSQEFIEFIKKELVSSH